MANGLVGSIGPGKKFVDMTGELKLAVFWPCLLVAYPRGKLGTSQRRRSFLGARCCSLNIRSIETCWFWPCQVSTAIA